MFVHKTNNLLILFFLFNLKLLIIPSESSKILALVPFPCKSHAILGSALLKELAHRGHNVTMISSFPLQPNERPAKNYHEIYVDPSPALQAHQETIVKAPKLHLFKAMAALECASRVNDAFLSSPNIRALLTSNEHFDLVISLGKESLLAVGHKLNASTIRFNMLGMHSIYAAVTMNPLPSSYVPNFLLPFSDEMNFFQRLQNTIMNLFFDLYINFIWINAENQVIQKHFPNFPHLTELQKNVDVTFVNSHMALDNIRPTMPNVIQIGGFHLKEEERLPDALKLFLDNAKNGVILFSMGSSIKSEVLQERLNETMKCFAQLPYHILWKHDGDIYGQPANVKTIKWLPQKAVLNHPNVKLFITHGGLGSVLESIYHAVPMIVLPIYLDQHNNAAQCAQNKIAIKLDVEQLTAGSLKQGIERILGDVSFKNAILMRSEAFRHQEIDPMERAVYWIEHVIKIRNKTNSFNNNINFNGADYLKCSGRNMPLYKYYLIDVIGLLTGLVVIFVWVVYFLVRMSLRFLMKRFQGKLKVN